ncbi:MAG: hypothetical protein GTO29_03850 [Candidatus Latescibacteria bacterium]|nr:hypothetical protein [Candidatus Latescibacterota bacterium]NIO55209.1 hypothetical protein [Candidatus Latescibacterota bacterium]
MACFADSALGKRSSIVSALLLCAGLSVDIASAQNVLLQSIPTSKSQITLRYLRPYFGDEYSPRNYDLSRFSGIYDLSCNLPVSSDINFIYSLPVIVYHARRDPSIYPFASIRSTYKENGIGNIFLGLQKRWVYTEETGANVSAGIFLPTASEQTSFSEFSLKTNFYEREKYWPKTLSIYGNFAYHLIPSRGGKFVFEFGQDIWIPTGKRTREIELLYHCGVSGGIHFSHIAVFLEYAGEFILTEEYPEFDDRFSNSVALGMQVAKGVVRPGGFYKFCLAEDCHGRVLGLKIDMCLE